MIFVAADIGGSRARLLLGRATPSGWQTLRTHTCVSGEHADAEALLANFLQPGDLPQTGCLAVAGPVAHGRVRMTNLPWLLDEETLAQRFGLRRMRLLNDFAAQGYGLDELGEDGHVTLQAGEADPKGVRALIGPGTGLGMAIVVRGEQHTQVLPSQGGHADFAPRDEQQDALMHHLRPVMGRVSLETLLCGRGLERIHRFLVGLPADAPPPQTAATIHAAALAGDSLAREATALFARILCAAAGDLALTTLAHGGVFLSGGIAPKILPFLQQADTLAAFSAKPPMDGLLARVPLHVVQDELSGLKGAARLAARLARESG